MQGEAVTKSSRHFSNAKRMQLMENYAMFERIRDHGESPDLILTESSSVKSILQKFFPLPPFQILAFIATYA